MTIPLSSDRYTSTIAIVGLADVHDDMELSAQQDFVAGTV